MKAILILLFSCIFTTIFAQNVTFANGDTFKIAEVDGGNYKYINFPKANFIIKKGGIVNYDSLVDNTVVIISIVNNDDEVIATLKLKSGKRFFNSHKYITVDILSAVQENELIPLN